MSKEFEYRKMLDRVDVVSLRLLSMLIREPNLSACAARLGISQPTASRKLALLREIIGDPLLIRSGSGLRLTDHAKKLDTTLAKLLALVETSLEAAQFDPRTDGGHLKIAGTDYAAHVMMVPLVRDLATAAPNLTIEFVPLVPETFHAMREGDVDLAFIADVPTPEDFVRQYLFDDHWIALIPSGHPLALETSPMSREELAQEQCAEFSYPTTAAMVQDKITTESRAKFATSFIGVLPQLVHECALIAPLPARLARSVSTSGLTQRMIEDAPSFRYFAIWHELKSSSPIRRFVAARSQLCSSTAC